MKRIDAFIRRRRIITLETWINRAIIAEVFFLALFHQAAMTAVVVGIVAWFFRLQIDKEFTIRSLPFDVPITIFIMLGAVSVFMSPARNFELIYTYCGIVGIFVMTYILIGQNVRTTEQVKDIAKALATAAVLVVICGYFQYFFGLDVADEKWTDIDAFPGMPTRIFSTLGNANTLACYLDVMICIALGFLAKFGTRQQKLILVFGVLCLTLCLAMTYSRGAFISLAIIFLIYGLLYDWRLFTLFVIFATILFYNDATLLERILSIFTDTNDFSKGMRIGIWMSTINMISDHPFIGIGWGAYEFIYPQYNYYLVDATQTIYHAHNLYLQMAVETGIAGALAYCWYFFGTMFLALNLSSNERYTKLKNIFGKNPETESESKFKKFFKLELAKTFSTSKFLQNLAQIKSMWKIRLEEIAHQIFEVFSKDKQTNKKTVSKKSEPELVHHEEMKWDAKNKKSDDKKSDDDNIDIQKFSAETELFEPQKKISDRQFIEGMNLGIGLAFLSMALNGLTDDVLFDIPCSILMWILGALAAAINLFDEEN